MSIILCGIIGFLCGMWGQYRWDHRKNFKPQNMKKYKVSPESICNNCKIASSVCKCSNILEQDVYQNIVDKKYYAFVHYDESECGGLIEVTLQD
jgi:hypothetical protein